LKWSQAYFDKKLQFAVKRIAALRIRTVRPRKDRYPGPPHSSYDFAITIFAATLPPFFFCPLHRPPGVSKCWVVVVRDLQRGSGIANITACVCSRHTESRAFFHVAWRWRIPLIQHIARCQAITLDRNNSFFIT
jgi:hypothetical protein